MALKNKLGITDSAELARMEEKLSKKKAVDLYESGRLDELEAGKFHTLEVIHETLFGEIYDFAGKVRKENIAKGNFRFAPVMYLQAALENIEKMPQSTYEEIIEKYVEIKVLLKAALTEETGNREIYMKGLDTSYFYEGYVLYKAEEL